MSRFTPFIIIMATIILSLFFWNSYKKLQEQNSALHSQLVALHLSVEVSNERTLSLYNGMESVREDTAAANKYLRYIAQENFDVKEYLESQFPPALNSVLQQAWGIPFSARDSSATM